MARRRKQPNWKLLQADKIVEDGSTYKMPVLGLQDTFVSVPIVNYGSVGDSYRDLVILAARRQAVAQDESVMNQRFEAGDYAKKIPLDRIEVSPKQSARRLEAHSALKQLMNSIEEHGLIQTPTVCPHPTKVGYYRALDGHRRFIAMRNLGYVWAVCNVVHSFDREETALCVINNTTRPYGGTDHFYTWAKTDPDKREDYLDGLSNVTANKINLMVKYLGLDRAIELALEFTAPELAVTAQTSLEAFNKLFPKLTQFFPTAPRLIEYMRKRNMQAFFKNQTGVWKRTVEVTGTASQDWFLRICIMVNQDLTKDDLALIKVPKVPKVSK